MTIPLIHETECPSHVLPGISVIVGEAVMAKGHSTDNIASVARAISLDIFPVKEGLGVQGEFRCGLMK